MRDEAATQAHKSRRDPDATNANLLLPDLTAELLTAIELETTVRPDSAGFVVRFRIYVSADGTAEEVEILENWLDQKTVEDLRRQLLGARYRPARRLGMPIASVVEGGLGLDDNEKGPVSAGPSIPNHVVPQ